MSSDKPEDWHYQQAVWHLRSIRDAAGGVAVADIQAVLEHLVAMSAEVAAGTPKPLPPFDTIEDYKHILKKVELTSELEELTLTAIENWLKRYRRRLKKIQTLSQRRLKVVKLFAEMKRGNISRAEALEKLGMTEDEIKQYTGPARKVLERSGLLHLPPPKRRPPNISGAGRRTRRARKS
jgi:hypothetical protein